MATYILFSSKVANLNIDTAVDKIGAFFTSEAVIVLLGISILVGIPMFS